jgi:hypothetical protein
MRRGLIIASLTLLLLGTSSLAAVEACDYGCGCGGYGYGYGYGTAAYGYSPYAAYGYYAPAAYYQPVYAYYSAPYYYGAPAYGPAYYGPGAYGAPYYGGGGYQPYWRGYWGGRYGSVARPDKPRPVLLASGHVGASHRGRPLPELAASRAAMPSAAALAKAFARGAGPHAAASSRPSGPRAGVKHAPPADVNHTPPLSKQPYPSAQTMRADLSAVKVTRPPTWRRSNPQARHLLAGAM